MIQFLHQADKLMDPFQSATHTHNAVYFTAELFAVQKQAQAV